MSNDELPVRATSHLTRPFTIAFFGRRCRLSRIPVEELVTCGASIVAIFLPSPTVFGPTVRRMSARVSIPLGLDRPLDGTQTLDHIASQNRIPLYAVSRPLAGELEATLAKIAPDLIVVSCFPWRIPRRARQITTYGAINVHPSRLPQFRGPDPLFWAFQTGTHDWGVTIHQMEDELDRGPILSQRAFEIPDRISGEDLESLAARIGAGLLRDTIARIRDGTVVASPQDESQATYLTFPGESDRVIRRDWTVRRALNFVDGIVSIGYAPLVETSSGIFEVVNARESHEPANEIDVKWRSTNIVRLALSDGVVDFAVRLDRNDDEWRR